MLLNIVLMQVFRPFALRGLQVCFLQRWSYLWRTVSSWLGEAQKMYRNTAKTISFKIIFWQYVNYSKVFESVEFLT